MRIICLSSGSQGNCYILKNETECLILDCGVKASEIKKALDYNILKIDGICITHGHRDHSLSADEFEQMGFKVFKPYESDKKTQTVKYGGFTVHSFKVPHDGTPCCGFLVEHKEIGKLIYMTDLEYPPFSFKSHEVEHIICEANYDMQFVDKDKPNYEHVLRGHLSLQACIEKVLEVNATPKLQNVILAHLSRSNADDEYFISEAQKVVDCPVYVAEKGLEIDLHSWDWCPFEL